MKENLWEKVGNQCLARAITVLERETVPTAATVETVKTLVDVAISIDSLNLCWAQQNRSAVAVSPGQSFSRQGAKN